MKSALAWLEERSIGAPAALVEQARYYLTQTGPVFDPVRGLADAGLAALETTVRAGSGRRAALDLLAADALVTLALLVQAETDPASLDAFARGVRQAGATRS